MIIELSKHKKQTDVDEIFAALHSPARIKLLKVLMDPPKGLCTLSPQEGEGVCECELSKSFDMAPSTVAHHLEKLARGGLVQGTRKGKWVYYSPNAEGIEAAKKAILAVLSIPEKIKARGGEA